MTSSLTRKAPPAIFALALFCFIVTLLSRGLFLEEDPPAFLLSKERKRFVSLKGAGLIAGVRQFNDDAGLTGANILTYDRGADTQLNLLQYESSAKTGESIVVVKKGLQINLLHNGWLPAAQRMALGIPLHPDQMTRHDWLALPGIGVALAERIEDDRQKNGDFGYVQALLRVKGIGEKRIEKWIDFF